LDNILCINPIQGIYFMRKKMVAGNWKMNGSRSQTQSLLAALKTSKTDLSAIDQVILPSFLHISQAQEILAATSIKFGAQNLYPGDKGAFTGEVSGAILADYGCQYVLVGHSERRQIFNEDLNLIAQKFIAAGAHGLQPILCIGETKIEREMEKTLAVIEQQLASVVEAASIEAFQSAVIAYEPVWAIGTGLTATPEQVQSVHSYIREKLASYDDVIAKRVRILYGGSVKADNARELFNLPDVDGGLIGGASLVAESFLAICAAALV
jgi:triosephosphate isomerase